MNRRTLSVRLSIWACVSMAVALLCAKANATGMTSSMIVEMREITSVSPSPDGARAVIGICHPNPRTNMRELSWVIVPLRGHAIPITVSAGEEVFDPAGPGGLLSVQVQWSRNGEWFFYPRRSGEEVQLWETNWNGGVTRQLTHSKADVIGLSASADPNELLVRLAPQRDLLRKAEHAEDRAGILYDDHVLGGFPLSRTFPIIDRWRNVRRSDDGKWLPPGWSGASTALYDIRRRELRPKSEEEAGDELEGKSASAVGACGEKCVESRVYRATAVPVNETPGPRGEPYLGAYTLQLDPRRGGGEKTGSTLRCGIAECFAKKITILGWSPDETEIYFVAVSPQGPQERRPLAEPPPGRALIYGWNPTGNKVRLIHDCGGEIYTLGSELASLRIIGREIVVGVDAPDEPPKLIAVDLSSGVSRMLLDPNAELRALTHGRAKWHTWPTSEGYPGHGIMVLPDNYEPARKYPLIITSYTCGPGFLQGGDSDNAPEFVAAHQGFLVICVDVPLFEIMARESDLSRIYPVACDIVAALIEDEDRAGSVDSGRVGLSGHSYGSDFGLYCLAHSLGKNAARGIAAAAFRSGSVLERASWDLFETAAWRRDPKNGIYARLHMPDPRYDPDGRWQEMSVANKASKINTPILIQASDTEYLRSLPLWSALREAGKPIDMYVFPNETHRLIQPAHQLVNLERQMDWFRFWLKDEEGDKPENGPLYGRWRRLRAATRDQGP